MKAEVVAEGLYFGEGPRWHAGRLWFSDFYDHAIKSLGVDGDVKIEHRFEGQTSGLGWLPDGRLLVVAMREMQLLRQEGDRFVVHADLSSLSAFMCNDMVVDRQGRAWVGNFGFDLDGEIAARGAESVMADHPTTNLVRVDPDGSVHCAASGMSFPNGTVVTPDGKTLVVAETLAMRLTAFDIGEDGQLGNRRTWAEVGARAPDGICLDADGHVWVANAIAPECVQVAEGGEILQTVASSENCFACMLGGPEQRDLYLLTAAGSDHKRASAARTGKIERVRVNSPGAGCP
jgi:sugar lactone lactonase YvrE